MALDENTRLRMVIEQVLPAEMIESLAREAGVVKRRRKLDVVLFVRTLVLGFGLANGRSLAGFRRLYQRLAGETIARSSFHQRFTQELVVVMKGLLDRALQLSKKVRHLGGAVDAFVEVLAIDSSIVRVTPDLADDWPGAWPNHSPATVKITAVTNVVGRDLRRLRLVPGSRHDMHMLEAGGWMKDRLIVFDLGFFGAKLFKEIDESGGFFLSRLKKNSKPFVLGSYHDDGDELVGYRLDEAQRRTQRAVLDVEAKLTYQDRPRKNRKHSVPFRVVALWSEESQTWHRYVTNAPPGMLAAKVCSAIYAARWEIELLFKELKSRYRMEEFRSNSGAVNLCLIISSLLSLVMSRALHSVVTRALRKQRVPHDRWSNLFAAVALDLLRICAGRDRDGALSRETLFFLRTEAPDPNRNRALLAERSSNGAVAFA